MLDSGSTLPEVEGMIGFLSAAAISDSAHNNDADDDDDNRNKTMPQDLISARKLTSRD
jgi:hypothetical protein